MTKRARKRRTIAFVLTVSLPILMWACSNAPQYLGGGRDLGPQGMPMGTTMEAGSDGSDSGVKTDTGVDTGVMDTGTGG